MTSSEQPRKVEIWYQVSEQGDDFWCSEALLVTPMGPNSYRLEETSAFFEACYHDIIETEPRTDGSLRFLRLQTPSGLKTLCWSLLPTDDVKSPALSALLGKVIAVGGHWERIHGGILLLHVPPAVHKHISDEFNNSFYQLPSDTTDH